MPFGNKEDEDEEEEREGEGKEAQRSRSHCFPVDTAFGYRSSLHHTPTEGLLDDTSLMIPRTLSDTNRNVLRMLRFTTRPPLEREMLFALDMTFLHYSPLVKLKKSPL